MPSSATRENNPGQRAHDRPVLLHSLIFLDEGQEVTAQARPKLAAGGSGAKPQVVVAPGVKMERYVAAFYCNRVLNQQRALSIFPFPNQIHRNVCRFGVLEFGNGIPNHSYDSLEMEMNSVKRLEWNGNGVWNFESIWKWKWN